MAIGRNRLIGTRLAKGDAEKADEAVDALRHAKHIKLVLTPDPVTQEKD